MRPSTLRCEPIPHAPVARPWASKTGPRTPEPCVVIASDQRERGNLPVLLLRTGRLLRSLRSLVRTPGGTFRVMTVGLLLVAFAIPFCVTAHGGGFEPYVPANEQLRQTILGVVESQALRPSSALGQRVHEALRSIKEIEGRTDLRVAGHLSAHMKSAWMELERSRAVGGLGYIEFDEATFQASEARFQEIVSRYSGVRAPYSKARNLAAIKALADAQALSRNTRRAVPGLSSDDVQLMQEKRQKLLLKEPREEGSGASSGGQAMPSR